MDHNIRNGVLVLGSTGFIGTHLVDRLAGLGYHVYALARSEVDATCGNVQRINGSIDDVAVLRKLIARCRHVIHVASLTTPSASASRPQLEIGGNLAALAHLLSLADDFPDRHLIYMSSAGAVYGDLAMMADEDSSLRPRSYYGAGKAAAEAFIHACTATTTWQAVVLRPSNIYGPGQHVGKGFAIVPTLLSRAAEGSTFQIWGDGQTVRDYCHVTDLVDLTIMAIEHEGSTKYAAYNAASGQTASILELVSACERSTGRRIEIEFQPARNVDVANVSLSTDSARATYRWKAQIPLAEGLDETWRWFLKSRSHEPESHCE